MDDELTLLKKYTQAYNNKARVRTLFSTGRTSRVGPSVSVLSVGADLAQETISDRLKTSGYSFWVLMLDPDGKLGEISLRGFLYDEAVDDSYCIVVSRPSVMQKDAYFRFWAHIEQQYPEICFWKALIGAVCSAEAMYYMSTKAPKRFEGVEPDVDTTAKFGETWFFAKMFEMIGESGSKNLYRPNELEKFAKDFIDDVCFTKVIDLRRFRKYDYDWQIRALILVGAKLLRPDVQQQLLRFDIREVVATGVDPGEIQNFLNEWATVPLRVHIFGHFPGTIRIREVGLLTGTFLISAKYEGNMLCSDLLGQTLDLNQSRIPAEALDFLLQPVRGSASSWPLPEDGDVAENFDLALANDTAIAIVREGEEFGAYAPVGGFRVDMRDNSPIANLEDMLVWTDGVAFWVMPLPWNCILYWKPCSDHNPLDDLYLYMEPVLAGALNLTLSTLWRDMVIAGPEHFPKRQRPESMELPAVDGAGPRVPTSNSDSRSRASKLVLPRVHATTYDGDYQWGLDAEREIIRRQAHLVCGFVRRLPYHWHRSDQAVENSRLFPHICLPDGYTFVKPHQRGGKHLSGERGDGPATEPSSRPATVVVSRGLATLKSLFGARSRPRSATTSS